MTRNNDILGKSPIFTLPPKPSTSPPPKPNIEELKECLDEELKFKEMFLDTSIIEEEKNCCFETTSNEKMKQRKKIVEKKQKNENHPFIKIIKEILNQKKRDIHAPTICFEFSKEAARKNWDTIKNYGGLDSLIRNSPFSPLTYGSEFKESWILAPLLHDHHLWPRFKNILDNGSIFPLVDPPPENVRLQDFDAILAYKNHKSAISNEEILNDHLLKELQKGWLIPLLPSDARKLNNAAIAPMGVVSQSTINELGEIVPSNRITHDLSFPGPTSGTSINSRTQMEHLEPCFYGHMLSRMIHKIVTYRKNYPTLPIVLQKVDFKSAYRRMNLNAETATQCLAQTSINGENFILLPLRLSFGGSACPAEWCIASEITTDLANRILNHPHWNPKNLSAKMSELIPPTELLDPTIPYHSSKPMIVEPTSEDIGKSDVYVDDICLVGVLKDNETEAKLKNSILLALEIVGRPMYDDEPLPRDDLASKSKLLAESGLSETKCILGWEINTRELHIKLSNEKYSIWSSNIQDILNDNGKTTKKTMEIIIGRLNHTASIIPISRHFLSRLYFSLSKMKDFKKYNLPKMVIKDLQLWQKILYKANIGISLNLLTYRAPNKLYWSDACEYGIGGFSSEGKAWRWNIPENLRDRAHINLLEFMAELAGIWDDIIENKLQPEDCLLAFGDSMTAMGWIHKSRYRSENDSNETAEARLIIARKLADLVIDNDLKLYSQWFAGSKNEVADLLSREGGILNDKSLTNKIISEFSQQVPKKFQSISTEARNNITLLRNAAENSQASATTSQYQQFNSTSWNKWISFLRSIELDDDPFMEQLKQHEQNQIITLFAQYLRSQPSQKGGISGLAEGTIRNTISTVVQTFLENHAPDPRLSTNGKTAISIRRILAGFKACDSNESRQKAVPVSVIRQVDKLHTKSGDPLSEATAQLTIGAFFFAMRSCEYSKTTSPSESKRTKIITIGDIRFFKSHKLINHNDPSLHEADIISITFRSQKNGEKNQTISMHTSRDLNICPVKVWASIVRRIRSYENTSDSSMVNCYISRQGSMNHITSNNIRTKLRAAAASLGEQSLGFTIKEIGCHSLRSGSAMAMYLAGVPVITIQLIGRWKSNAFMRYIREQVDCFTENISNKILTVNSFYTIPNKSPDPHLNQDPANTQNGTDLSKVFGTLVL